MLDTLLHLVPLLVLLVPLLRGRFVGEGTIEKMRDRAASRERRPRAEGTVGRPRLSPAPLPRGGRLIATSLAVRPPPSQALA